MAIAVAEAVANILYRAANVFVRQAGTTGDFLNMGVVRSVTVTSALVETSPDSAGRKVEIGVDFTAQFTMAQTADTDIGALDAEVFDQLNDLLISAIPYAGDIDTGLSDVNLSNFTGNSVLVQDILLNADIDLDFMGNESGIAFEVAWRVRTEDLAADFPED